MYRVKKGCKAMEENKNLTRHSNQRLQSGPQNLVVSDNKLAIQNELTNEDIKNLIYTIKRKTSYVR